MHVAVFLQYYHTPDCPTAARPYALVKRLAQTHDVTVITTRTWETKRLSNNVPWVPSGVNLIRFDVPYENSMAPLERLRAFLSYAGRAVAYGLQMPAPDLIIGSSTPLTAAMAAGLVASLRGIPWIFEVRDLWPDFPIQMGALPNFGLHRLLRNLETVLYRSAAHVVTLSDDMEQHVRTAAPAADTTTLEYGADLQLVDDITENQRSRLRQKYGLDRRKLVLYAGTFGRANTIPTLLDAAKQFAHRSDVLFAFAGRGYYESAVQRTADRHDHIRVVDPLPYPDTLALFSLADVSLVSFLDRPVLTTNSPGKLYDSLATGTPVVITNPGWTKRLVEQHECGWYVPPESPNRLAHQLQHVFETPNDLEKAAANARITARQRFDRAELMDQYARLVDNVKDAS